MSPTSQTHSGKGEPPRVHPFKLFGKHYLRWVPACAVVTQTEIALYLRGKEGNRTTYAEERTEDLEKYGILVVGQDQDRPGIKLGFCILFSETKVCGL